MFILPMSSANVEEIEIPYLNKGTRLLKLKEAYREDNKLEWFDNSTRCSNRYSNNHWHFKLPLTECKMECWHKRKSVCPCIAYSWQSRGGIVDGEFKINTEKQGQNDKSTPQDCINHFGKMEHYTWADDTESQTYDTYELKLDEEEKEELNSNAEKWSGDKEVATNSEHSKCFKKGYWNGEGCCEKKN